MTTKSLPRLVVLISGSGSNLQAILDACQSGYIPASVCAVVSNKSDAFGLERARQSGVRVEILIKRKDQDRLDYDRQLANRVESHHPDWVILAGWMRLLSDVFLSRFPNRVINLHPALPGTFPGTEAIKRAFVAFQNHEITQTGVMVHLVPDEGVDNGPLLAQEIILIHAEDSLTDLEKRVHHVEHRLLVETVRNLVK